MNLREAGFPMEIEQRPENVYGTGTEDGDVQSDSEVWEVEPRATGTHLPLVVVSLRNAIKALADVAQWIERHSVNQKVTGLIPSQGWGPGLQLGGMQVTTGIWWMFLSLPFSLLSLLSKNK